MIIELTPEGYTADGKWRLVPVEATKEMMLAGSNMSYMGSVESAKKALELMLKAAPLPTLKSRYDWSKIPAEFNWAATSKTGASRAFSNSPDKLEGLGVWFGGGGILIENVDACPDWRESLERRPG